MMYTSERANCQIKKCGSQNAASSKFVVFKRSVEDDRRKDACESKGTENSPLHGSPGKLVEHESTLNLMSDTLMSVANKLEKVFNNPEERSPVSRPTIKRVYVIKFDENSLEAVKSASKPTRRLREEASDSFSDLINDVTSPPEQRGPPSSGPGHKSRFNYKLRSKDKMSWSEPRKYRIHDIFNAISEEIGSISSKNRRTQERPRNARQKQTSNMKLKTLSKVLESEQSLVGEKYAIPRSMIKLEAIDRLQTLIDRADKRSRRERSISSDKNSSIAMKDSEVVDWEVPERLTSYHTTIINDNDLKHDIDTSSSVVSGPICRICHGPHGTLVKPCRCRGTLAYVHVECLRVWLTEKDVNFCEICNFTFGVTNVPEHKIIPSIGYWYKFAATDKQRRTIIVDLTLAILLLPFLIFLTIFVHSFTSNAKAEYEEDEEFEDNVVWHFGQMTIKVAIFLVNLSYIAGVLIRVDHHLSDWFSWHANENGTVLIENLRQNHDDEAE